MAKGMFDNLGLNGMFTMVDPRMVRLSMKGNVAVYTKNGYKTYSVKNKRLMNCGSFVFDVGNEFFFLFPTSHVVEGDIIMVNGAPKCVIGVYDTYIEVINYDNSTIDRIVPERHMLIGGDTYFYGKIVSPFNFKDGGDNFQFGQIYKFKLMMELMKHGFDFGTGTGTTGKSSGGEDFMSQMMKMSMVSAMFGNGGMFGNMFGDAGTGTGGGLFNFGSMFDGGFGDMFATTSPVTGTVTKAPATTEDDATAVTEGE